MTLADERLRELDDPTLTEERRVTLRCEVADDLMCAGQYEAAREALGGLWRGIGERPEVKHLPPVVAAEVLLQCGALTGWLGRARSVDGAQDRAKDLIFEAQRVFTSQGQITKVSEAQYELGMCYQRLGSYDEARVVLREALKPLGDDDTELRAKILIRLTVVEVWANRNYEALEILKEAEPIFESASGVTKGKWHGQRAIILLKLAHTEGRQDYADRAIIEFTAAIHYYERAGHERYCALNLNNLAFVLYRVGKYPEAHEQLDRAREIFSRFHDPGNTAQVDETRARVLVAEQRYDEADRVIRGVVQTFEQGGEAALLANALTVQGVVRARLLEHESSVHVLRRAVQVAQDAGAEASAGLAALTLIEEHGANRLKETELVRLYLCADELLRGSQDVEDATRLRDCARIVFDRLSGATLPGSVTLTEAKIDLEARYIEWALEMEHGSVSRAAKRLGMKHQSLTHLLRTRHQRLAHMRTPAEKRFRSIIRKPGEH